MQIICILAILYSLILLSLDSAFFLILQVNMSNSGARIWEILIDLSSINVFCR